MLVGAWERSQGSDGSSWEVAWVQKLWWWSLKEFSPVCRRARACVCVCVCSGGPSGEEEGRITEVQGRGGQQARRKSRERKDCRSHRTCDASGSQGGCGKGGGLESGTGGKWALVSRL